MTVLSAQAPAGLETPFVSRLRVERESGQLQVYWLDAPSLQGERYEIYRATAPITAENFSTAVLAGTVEEGVQGFSDKPPAAGDYFYTVLARDASGELRTFFAPFRNVLMSSVSYTPSAPASQILDMAARVVGDRVILSFRSTDSTSNIMVFRTSDYPESRADLEKGLLLATLPGSATSYQDIPPAGLPFYYTAVDARTYTNAGEGLFTVSNRTAESIGLQLTQVQTRPRVVGPEPAPSLAAADTEIIIPDIAALLAQNRREPSGDTDSPSSPSAAPSEAPTTTISLADLGYREQVLRALPLPKLAVSEDINTGIFREGAYNPLPRAQAVGQRTAAVLSEIAKNFTTPELPPPLVLAEETSAQQGIGLRLSTVVRDHWEKQNWEQAVTALDALLDLDLESKMRDRVYFYRAQAYAFMGQGERAAFDFILAQNSYRAEASKFLDVLLLSGSRSTN